MPSGGIQDGPGRGSHHLTRPASHAAVTLADASVSSTASPHQGLRREFWRPPRVDLCADEFGSSSASRNRRGYALIVARRLRAQRRGTRQSEVEPGLCSDCQRALSDHRQRVCGVLPRVVTVVRLSVSDDEGLRPRRLLRMERSASPRPSSVDLETVERASRRRAPAVGAAAERRPC